MHDFIKQSQKAILNRWDIEESVVSLIILLKILNVHKDDWSKSGLRNFAKEMYIKNRNYDGVNVCD